MGPGLSPSRMLTDFKRSRRRVRTPSHGGRCLSRPGKPEISRAPGQDWLVHSGLRSRMGRSSQNIRHCGQRPEAPASVHAPEHSDWGSFPWLSPRSGRNALMTPKLPFGMPLWVLAAVRRVCRSRSRPHRRTRTQHEVTWRAVMLAEGCAIEPVGFDAVGMTPLGGLRPLLSALAQLQEPERRRLMLGRLGSLSRRRSAAEQIR